MKRAFFLAFVLFTACGGDEPKPVTPAASATTPPPPTPPTTPPAPVETTPPPAASSAPATPAADPNAIPADKLQGYIAIWKEYFAKENGITVEELDKRVVIKKTESELRNYSRTVLEITFDFTSSWATIKGAQSELLTRIKARSSDPPPGVRFDTWLEASDYTAMKAGKALITTRLGFGALRFPKQADAEKAAEAACKGRKRMNDYQVAIAGDGALWLVSLWQTADAKNVKENRPCGVDLTKNKGGEIMNFDAGDGSFK